MKLTTHLPAVKVAPIKVGVKGTKLPGTLHTLVAMLVDRRK